MKKAIFALAVAALGCVSLGAQNYLIEGTAADMDGKKVYIGELKSKKDIFYADSTIIENGQFKLTGKLDSIKPLSIFIGRKHQAFLLDENPIKVSYPRVYGQTNKDGRHKGDRRQRPAVTGRDEQRPHTRDVYHARHFVYGARQGCKRSRE